MYVHAINKLAYEFTCANESVAKRVHREIEDHAALQINNIISFVLSDHFNTDRHLKIDKIEINLGDILLSDFGDTGLLDNFKKLFEEELSVTGNAYKTKHYKSDGHDTAVPDPQKRLYNTIPVAGNGNRVGYDNTIEDDAGSPDNLDNELAIIRMLLMQGDVPWWADKKTNFDFDDTLQKLIRFHPNTLISFLEEHQERWQVLWRLTKQYKPATRVMLDALAPGILSASISRKIFKGDDALSGGHLFPHIIWVKLKSLLNKRIPGSVDQLRHTLLKKMIKVADLVKKTTGISSILPGIGMAGNSPGGFQHQTRKKTKERLKSLVSNLSVFQIEFLLFQLTLLPDFSTDAYRTPERIDASDNTDLSGHKAGHQEKNITRQKEADVIKTTRTRAAIHPGDDDRIVDIISTNADTYYRTTTTPEAPDLLPGDHIDAEHRLPDHHQSDDDSFNNNSQGQKAAFLSGKKPVIPKGNQFTDGDKNPQLLNQKSHDPFVKIAEELARLQHQKFTASHKHLLISQDEKDKASIGTIPIAGKSDGNLVNDEHKPDQFTFHKDYIIQDKTTPNASGSENRNRELPSFTSPDEDPPATGQIKHIIKQSGHTDLHNPFASAEKEKLWSAQTPAGSSNRVNRKIAFVMKRLNTTEGVFFQYLNHLQESELDRLEEMLKKHIRQKLQRRNKIKAILEHPHFLKFNILKIFTNLYFDKEQEKAWSVDPEKIAANRKSPATDIAERIQWSQSAFLFFTDKLPVKQVMILQDIFEKQKFDSGDEKKVMKKILGKISEEGLLLIEFLTELPETEVRELLQTNKKPLADITPRNQAPVFYERNEPFKIYIENAGLCLIANYLRGLFKRLDYLENGSFKTKAIAVRAIFLLQYMVTGKKKCPEHVLQLNKILCGFKTDDCIIAGMRLTKKEVEEADNLIQSVIENWKALKNTSLNGFRESFLQRKGILFENESYWTLQVEKKGYDLLLDTIPWGFRMIKMPWVKKYMQVEW